MLRFVATVALLLATALAAPQLNIPQQQQQQQAQAYHQQADQTTAVPIINFEDSQPGDGTFKYAYETGNGIKLEGSGFTKKAVVPQYDESGARQEDVEKDVLVQVGSYSYTAPDGQVITVKYIADENGFQPQGDHIPTPPTVPEAIANSLNQQANIQQQQQFGQQTRNGQQQQQFGQQTRNGQQQQQFGEGQKRSDPHIDARSDFNGQSGAAAATNNLPFQVVLP